MADDAYPVQYWYSHGTTRFSHKPKLLRFYSIVQAGLSHYLTALASQKSSLPTSALSPQARLAQIGASLLPFCGSMVSHVIDIGDHTLTVERAEKLVFFTASEIDRLSDVIAASITMSYESHISRIVISGFIPVKILRVGIGGQIGEGDIELPDLACDADVVSRGGTWTNQESQDETTNKAIDKLALIAIQRIYHKLSQDKFIKRFARRADKTLLISFNTAEARSFALLPLYLNLIMNALTLSGAVEKPTKGKLLKTVLRMADGSIWYADSIYAKSPIHDEHRLSYVRMTGKSRSEKYFPRMSLGEYDIFYDGAIWCKASLRGGIVGAVSTLVHNLDTVKTYTRKVGIFRRLQNTYNDDQNVIKLLFNAHGSVASHIAALERKETEGSALNFLRQANDVLRQLKVEAITAHFLRLEARMSALPSLKYQVYDEVVAYMRFLRDECNVVWSLDERHRPLSNLFCILPQALQRFVLTAWDDRKQGKMIQALETTCSISQALVSRASAATRAAIMPPRMAMTSSADDMLQAASPTDACIESGGVLLGPPESPENPGAYADDLLQAASPADVYIDSSFGPPESPENPGAYERRGAATFDDTAVYVEVEEEGESNDAHITGLDSV